MKWTLYQKFMPEAVREKLYKADVRRYKNEQYDRRLRIENALPRSELSSSYIANLQIVINRDALLKEFPKQAVVAEIGAEDGRFSSKILLVTDPRQLVLIEDWPEKIKYDNAESVVANKFKKEIGDGQLLMARGEPASVLSNYDDGYFDWIYINSDPTFETTKTLLELCGRKVNRNGIIAGNNYTTSSYLDLVRYGVIEAVHEFCKKYRWEMIYLTHERSRRLSYSLKRIAS